MRRKNPTNWIEILITVGVIGVFGLVAFSIVEAIVLEYKHPCLETRQVMGVCGGDSYCSFMDQYGVCTTWSTNPTYSCAVNQCVRRQP